MRNLINITDLSVDEINELIEIANDIIADPEAYMDICHGKVLATLFFEPSTRTRLSFTSAMMYLGGQVLGFSEAASSSAAKGESVSDTVRTVGAYSDIIAMRHPKEGAPMIAAERTTVPIINAGDGGHFHPTQTLTDLLISPHELRIPKYMREIMERSGVEWKEVERMEDVMSELDILYMTRVQRERFFNEEDYVRLKDTYILDMDKLHDAKEDLAILHPLPRVNEIAVEVDDDPRAKYFDQVLCGRFIRMALILRLLEIK